MLNVTWRYRVLFREADPEMAVASSSTPLTLPKDFQVVVHPLEKGQLYHAFIAHGSEDLELSYSILDALEKLGFKCFHSERDFTVNIWHTFCILIAKSNVHYNFNNEIREFFIALLTCQSAKLITSVNLSFHPSVCLSTCLSVSRGSTNWAQLSYQPCWHLL